MPLIVPDEAWKPAVPEITNAAASRSPAALMAVIDQFQVMTRPRYQPRVLPGRTTPSTFCNIFLWDVTLALGAEIPHWCHPTTGAPVAPGKGDELTANATCDWLQKFGSAFGWRATTVAEAIAYTQSGRLAVPVWKNPKGGSGHVAIGTPSTSGLRVAQAGRINFVDRPLTQGFGQVSPILYYVHD